MTNAEALSAITVRFAMLAVVAIALTLASTSFAQTMGEYGGMTANADTSSGIAAPKMDSSIQSAPARETGPSQSVEVRDDDSDPPLADQQIKGDDAHSIHPSDDWTQVKSSDD
jgi:hypothetical protein